MSRHSAGAEPPGDPVLLAGREPLPELLEELGLARETELAGQLARSRGYELGERLVGDVEGPAVQRGGGGREAIGVASPCRRSSAPGDAHLTDSRPRGPGGTHRRNRLTRQTWRWPGQPFSDREPLAPAVAQRVREEATMPANKRRKTARKRAALRKKEQKRRARANR